MLGGEKAEEGGEKQRRRGGGILPKFVVLTEVSIIWRPSSDNSTSLLKGAWIQAAKELDVEIADVGAGENESALYGATKRPLRIRNAKAVLATKVAH
ncbi:hypothetical protein Syun_019757 [Stephania yunnanensis]|uniref:Uncharacterized protein n=1 Tax=Stephania yunnanensis TaxID=152371 RepID=A0AAP0NY94_9MAGN